MRTFLPKDLEIALGLRILAAHQFVYEHSGGLVGSRVGPYRLLLLRTRGRRSGRLRTASLLYLEDGDDLVVVGSKGGSDSPPGWLLNLQSDPEVEVQVGTRSWLTRARLASPAERRRLWPRMVATWRDYERYQRRSAREIPLVLLGRG